MYRRRENVLHRYPGINKQICSIWINSYLKGTVKLNIENPTCMCQVHHENKSVINARCVLMLNTKSPF